MNIIIISSGLQVPSSSSKLSKLFKDELLKSHENNVEVFELRNLAHSITDNLLVGFPSNELKEVLEKLYAADGVIFVTPVYNASFNALFKSFVDILDVEKVKNLPVVVAGVGGTPRHSLVLEYAVKPVFSHLHMPVADPSVFVTTDDWGAENEMEGSIISRINTSLNNLQRLIEARVPRTDPYDFLSQLNFN